MALNFPFKQKSSDLSDLTENTDPDDEFLKAVSLFTNQRTKIGISLEELSKKTKISRNVLIAIEKGLKKYLPEATYLITMLKILEIELDLEKGSLNGLSSKKITINNNFTNFKFNFINIDFINSWIGSFLYLILMFLSILALNSQQKYLLQINSVSTEPVIINEPNVLNENKINIKNK
tara:strand:+ start:2379 stop:2912 length:534 start_codon:yes stop_codon:yes gene_type:complete